MANSGYQQGTTAAPQKARAVLATAGAQVTAVSPQLTPASLTTAVAGANNDITYTAVEAGTVGDKSGLYGNQITIAYVVAGASTPLSVSVTGAAITVNVATNGSSAAISTAAQVRDAVNASEAARKLVSAALAPGNDGTGVVAALSATPLAGGADVVHGLASGAPLPTIFKSGIHYSYN